MFVTRTGEVIDDASTTITKGENITYLYRLLIMLLLGLILMQRHEIRAVNGLSLESHAARCAQLFGVPAHVVERAQYVTYVPYNRLVQRGPILDDDLLEFGLAAYSQGATFCA